MLHVVNGLGCVEQTVLELVAQGAEYPKDLFRQVEHLLNRLGLGDVKFRYRLAGFICKDSLALGAGIRQAKPFVEVDPRFSAPMGPLIGSGIVAVISSPILASGGHLTERVSDKGDLVGRHDRMQGDPDPARFCGEIAASDSAGDPLRGSLIDAQQIMAIRSRAGAAAAGLDAKVVVQQLDGQVIVNLIQGERDDPQTLAARPAQDGQPWDGFQLRQQPVG